MNILNKFFDKVFCITVPSYLDRQKKCNEQFIKYNIDFEYVPAVEASYLRQVLDLTGNIKISPPEFSLAVTHMFCMQTAQLHGLNSICILEDDFVLYDDWETKFETFTKELPEDWKMLYLGQAEWMTGIYDSKKIYYSENVSVCKYGCGSHFMGFNKSIFDVCIEQIKRCDCPVDVCYNIITSDMNECYAPYGSFANAISIPHEKFHDRIPNFKKEDYIPSLIRDYSVQP